jgi:hypothetical protein
VLPDALFWNERVAPTSVMNLRRLMGPRSGSCPSVPEVQTLGHPLKAPVPTPGGSPMRYFLRRGVR